MKASEWTHIVNRMVVAWPDRRWSNKTADLGGELLGPMDYQQVLSVVDSMIRDGRTFPPAPGELYKRVCDLSVDHPEWGEVWAEISRAIDRFGSYAVLAEGKVVSASVTYADEHIWSTPLVEQVVRMVGWSELCTYDLDNQRTMEAQCRNKYEALVERARQDRAWEGIPPAGLPRLEAIGDQKQLPKGRG